MKKQWFLLSAVAVVLAGSLVACSSGGESPEPATESSGNVTEPANSDASTSGDSFANSTVTDEAAADGDAENGAATDAADSPDTSVSAEVTQPANSSGN